MRVTQKGRWKTAVTAKKKKKKKTQKENSTHLLEGGEGYLRTVNTELLKKKILKES